MRPPLLLRPRIAIPFVPSTLPKLLPRLYSTSAPPSSKSKHEFISSFTFPTAHSNGVIRVISLCRPAARNAISVQLLQELRAHIDDIASEYDSEGNERRPLPLDSNGQEIKRTRALIIASEVDGVFCAGADLKERKGFTAEQTQTFLQNLRGTFTALSSLPIPTISAISSVALGGGLELALCTHMRVLASTAVIGLPETKLGIIPGAGGTYRLPALIGVGRARDMILTGRRVSASEAYFLGVADRLVDVGVEEEGEEGGLMKRAREEVLREAVRLAGEITEGGPIATRSALRAVGWAREEVENEMYGRVVGTEDRNEALAAFAEKRKPVFKGR
ncbi:enoyl- hydratase isomerase protein [Rutstroemia sp. NJR-2017a BBW]|nr:enoyl- hydratase isomerase protein [Rutstroemia sp. NJR-2017a BBW]